MEMLSAPNWEWCQTAKVRRTPHHPVGVRFRTNRPESERLADGRIKRYRPYPVEIFRDQGFSSLASNVIQQERTSDTLRDKETALMHLLQDLSFTFRQLARNLGFATVVVLTLALGIGANTSIFSVVNAVLLNPLPSENADDVVFLSETVRREITELRSLSYPDFKDWRDQNGSFESIVAFADTSFTLVGTNGATRIEGEIVSAGYFELLGIEMQMGRTFTPEEDKTPGSHPVAMISHGLWQRSFGGNPRIIGRSINLNDRVLSVVGVAPLGFLGLDDDTEAWIPMMMATLTVPASFLEGRSARWHSAIARLKPGVSVTEAQAEMDAIARRLEEEYSDSNENYGASVMPFREALQAGIRTPLLILLATVGFVLLIACANVGNLMLARMTSRERETAVRAAMGAGRGRLLRQFLTESVVLSGLGGLLGILVSLWMIEILKTLNPVALPSFVEIAVDTRVLLFTLLVATVTGLVIGTVAAFQGSSPQLSETLRSGGRGGGRSAQQRVRGLLVVSEVGLALVLLIGAGLMVSSFSRMQDIAPGFEADSLATLRIAVPADNYDDDEIWPLEQRLLEAVTSLPSVVSAALTTDMPLEDSSSASFVTPEDYDPDLDGGVRIYRHSVSPGFFATTGLSLLRGRMFDSRETPDSSRSVIATYKFVRRVWKDSDPIGKRIKFGNPGSTSDWMIVIGVVADLKYRTLIEDPTQNRDDPDLFFALSQTSATNVGLLVRTGTDNPSGLAASLEREIKAIDRGIPIYAFAQMKDLVEQQTAGARFTAFLMGVFGSLALALAAIGIYGVISYSVAQRKHEIGVRTALGAQRSEVFGLVIRHALTLTGAGVGLGLAAALALTRLLTSQLYQVSPTEPIVFAGMSAVLLLVALVASCVPARRATRVDPLICLRHD